MNEIRNEKGVFVAGHPTSQEVRDKIAKTLDQTGDLVGQRFGSWLVLERREITYGHRRWLCRCDCGFEKEVSQRHLVKGKSTCCLKCSGLKNSGRAKDRCVDLNGRIKYRANGGKRGFYWTEVRKKQFEKQKGICPICLEPLSSPNESFDHNHVTGYCREIVHKGCNVLIGFVENHPDAVDRVKNYLNKYNLGDGRDDGG